MKTRHLRRRWKSMWPSRGIRRGKHKVWWFRVEGEHPITYDEMEFDYILRWK